MIAKTIFLSIMVLFATITNLLADDLFTFKSLSINLGEGIYTNQTDSNALFAFNGGAEADIYANFKIGDSFKLRIGSGYIKKDMWVEHLDTVNAMIYPISISFMNCFKNDKANSDNLKYVGIGVAHYPAKVTYTKIEENSIGVVTERIEIKVNINSFGPIFFAGFENYLSKKVTCIGEVILRNASFKFDSNEFSIDGVIFKIGLGYHFS